MSVAGEAAATARVLVVEDFAQLREVLVEGLERAGFAVDGAGSVREALSLHPEAYDILVVDHRLGDGLGTDLFRIVADRDGTLASRFILMTADEHDIELPAGVPVLLKPFRIATLVDTVRRVDGAGRASRDAAQTPGG